MKMAALSFLLFCGTAHGARPIQIPGPVPDYAPLAMVRTHAQARDLSRDFVDQLTGLLGPRHTIVGEEDERSSLIWLRDYQPIYARDATNQLRALRVHSGLPERNGQSFPGDPPGIDLNLIHENGNLVVAGRYVFISVRFLEDNRLVGPGGVAMQRPVLAGLARVLSRSEEDLIMMPRMPGEGTGHVDLYLLPIADDTVLVPRIADEALVDLTEGERLVGRDAAGFLDEQAEFLARLGLTVKRLSMLAPRIQAAVDTDTDVAVFYSPANALLLNVGGQRTVMLPDIDPSVLRAKHRKLFHGYRQQWAKVFRAEGWKPEFADATQLSRYLGLFRCLTTMVPEQ